MFPAIRSGHRWQIDHKLGPWYKVDYAAHPPWEVPDFSVERYRSRLAELHGRIVAEGGLRIRGHLFIIEAYKP